MEGKELFDQVMVVVMIAIFSGVVVNGLYVFLLGRFYKELEQKDPEAWEKAGSPRLGEQMSHRPPGFKNRSFYAFLGPLREKARLPNYPAAGSAWLAFRLAAVATTLVFLMVGACIYYLVSQGVS